MDAQAWEKAQARLRDLFPDKVLRCKLHKKLTAQPHPERFFDDDDDDATSEALLTLLPEAGMAEVTLAELVTQAMPILVHSHSISFNPIEAAYRATPESVSSWETFRAEVATFCSTLANSDPCYNTKPFPLSLGGACEILSEGDINVYLELYLYRPLENVPRLPGFAKHAFVRHHGVPDMLGQPDWAAVGYRPGSQPQLLFVAESKTCQTLPIPPETTTAAVWQDTTSRGSIADAVDHVFGYMLVNDLRYSLLTSGEVFVFMQRNGRSLQVADIHRSRDMLTPMAAVYYLMHRAAEAPARLLRLRGVALAEATNGLQPSSEEAAHPAPSGAFRKQAACSKEAWSLQELGLTSQIGIGRTARVYEGCIDGTPVAVKMVDYAASQRTLQDLQHEAAVYEHLRGEQGISVPRFGACGYIIDSTLYFIAMELLGPSLYDTAAAEKLQPAALRALNRVHACGVLHGDVRACNFLRSGHKGVLLADLAYAKLAADPQLLQKERRDAPRTIRSRLQLQAAHRQSLLTKRSFKVQLRFK